MADQTAAVEAHCAEGERLFRQGQFALAEQRFRQALLIDPRYYGAQHALGLIALQRGDLAQAIAHLDRACSVRPCEATVRINLGNALARSGRYADAIASYDLALSVRPNDVEALYNRATALMFSEQLPGAIDGYRQVLSIAPNHGDALFNLASAALRIGRHEEAGQASQRLLKQLPDDIEVLAMLLDALRHVPQAGDVEAVMVRAERAAQAAIGRASPSDAAFVQRIIGLVRAFSKHDEAGRSLSLCDLALVKFFSSADLHLARGQTLTDLVRPRDAIEAYGRALALRSGDFAALNNRGVDFVQLGEFDAAIESFDRALRTGVAPGAVLVNVGTAKKFMRENDRHLQEIEKLLRDVEKMPSMERLYLHFAAGKAFDDVGRYGEAFDHFAAGGRIKRGMSNYDVQADVRVARALAETCDAEWLAARSDFGCRDAAPIFVFGMPRTGTTLVEQLIAGHPNAKAMGETGFFGRAMRHLTRGYASSLEDVARSLSGAKQFDIGKRYFKLAQERGVSGGERPVDKTLESSHQAALIAASLPGALFIHVRREPMDNCLACYSTLFTSGYEFSYDLDELLAYRLSYDELMSHWGRVLPPDRLLEVDYEAIVFHFEREARRIVEFCGLKWTSAVLDFTHVNRPVSTGSAFQVRQGLYSSSIGRWRNYRAALASVERVLAPQAARQAVS